MSEPLLQILLWINFFLLSMTVLAAYHYAHRLKIELRRSDRLRKTAEKFQELFHSTSEGVYQTDMEGNVVLINRGGARILGYETPEELIRERPKAPDSYSDKKDRDLLLKRVLEEGKVENALLKVVKRNGDAMLIETTIHMKREKKSGEIAGFEGIFRDVTRRVAMEEEIRRYSMDLEKKVKKKTEEVLALERKRIELEKLASLGRVAATIVHEIKNPLTSIKMGLMTLRKRARLEERDVNCLDLARREVAHLERFLRDLLNFAKPQEMKFVEHDIDHVLDITLKQIEQELDEEHVRLKRESVPHLPRVWIDSDRMSQVFMNILLNAKRVLKGGGEIIVRTTSEPESGLLSIEFEDNGPGIKKHDLEHVFEPFFSTSSDGTGLGLTVVQRIVEAHAGRVDIESKFRQGTKVTISLPVETQDQQQV